MGWIFLKEQGKEPLSHKEVQGLQIMSDPSDIHILLKQDIPLRLLQAPCSSRGHNISGLRFPQHFLQREELYTPVRAFTEVLTLSIRSPLPTHSIGACLFHPLGGGRGLAMHHFTPRVGLGSIACQNTTFFIKHVGCESYGTLITNNTQREMSRNVRLIVV